MDIKTLIRQIESETLEFKESLQLKDEIGVTVSAFANLKGGIILVGISDKLGIKGIQIGKKTLSELAEYIKKNTDPSIYPEIETHKIEDKIIITIEKIKIGDSIKSREIQKQFSVTRDTANRDLNYLIKIGLIKREGRGKKVKYTLK